jgi:hypothetical protein
VIISNEAAARGLLRFDARGVREYAVAIAELASSESDHLYDYWLGRNQCDDTGIQAFVGRKIHRELLAFLLCVT